MAGRGDIDAISISISANTDELTRSVEAARAKLDRLQDKKVKINVTADIDDTHITAVTDKIRNAIQPLTQGEGLEIPIQPSFKFSQSAVRGFRRDLRKQLWGGGAGLQHGDEVTVPIKPGKINKAVANKAIKDSIGDVQVGLTWRWVDENAAAAIANSIGTIDVALKWHWDGDPPPEGHSGGGSPPVPPKTPSPGTSTGAPRTANQPSASSTGPTGTKVVGGRERPTYTCPGCGRSDFLTQKGASDHNAKHQAKAAAQTAATPPPTPPAPEPPKSSPAAAEPPKPPTSGRLTRAPRTTTPRTEPKPTLDQETACGICGKVFQTKALAQAHADRDHAAKSEPVAPVEASGTPTVTPAPRAETKKGPRYTARERGFAVARMRQAGFTDEDIERNLERTPSTIGKVIKAYTGKERLPKRGEPRRPDEAIGVRASQARIGANYGEFEGGPKGVISAEDQQGQVRMLTALGIRIPGKGMPATFRSNSPLDAEAKANIGSVLTGIHGYQGSTMRGDRTYRDASEPVIDIVDAAPAVRMPGPGISTGMSEGDRSFRMAAPLPAMSGDEQFDAWLTRGARARQTIASIVAGEPVDKGAIKAISELTDVQKARESGFVGDLPPHLMMLAKAQEALAQSDTTTARRLMHGDPDADPEKPEYRGLYGLLKAKSPKAFPLAARGGETRNAYAGLMGEAYGGMQSQLSLLDQLGKWQGQSEDAKARGQEQKDDRAFVRGIVDDYISRMSLEPDDDMYIGSVSERDFGMIGEMRGLSIDKVLSYLSKDQRKALGLAATPARPKSEPQPPPPAIPLGEARVSAFDQQVENLRAKFPGLSTIQLQRILHAASLGDVSASELEGRAKGGPVQAGKAYVVGEEGPEVIKMASDGDVIPNDMLKSIPGVYPTGVLLQSATEGLIPMQEDARFKRYRNKSKSLSDVVARNDTGYPVGMLQVWHRVKENEPTEGEDFNWTYTDKVGDIFPYVQPEYRRRGIGTRLYDVASQYGLDAEKASEHNWTNSLQTRAGSALFEARRRRAGLGLPELSDESGEEGRNLEGRYLRPIEADPWFDVEMAEEAVKLGLLPKAALAYYQGQIKGLSGGGILGGQTESELISSLLDSNLGTLSEFEESADLFPSLKVKKMAGFGGQCGVCGKKFASDKGYKKHIADGHLGSDGESVVNTHVGKGYDTYVPKKDDAYQQMLATVAEAESQKPWWQKAASTGSPGKFSGFSMTKYGKKPYSTHDKTWSSSFYPSMTTHDITDADLEDDDFNPFLEDYPDDPFATGPSPFAIGTSTPPGLNVGSLYSCKECKASYSTAWSLKVHEEDVHGSGITCPDCGISGFEHAGQLGAHQLVKHPDSQNLWDKEKASGASRWPKIHIPRPKLVVPKVPTALIKRLQYLDPRELRFPQGDPHLYDPNDRLSVYSEENPARQWANMMYGRGTDLTEEQRRAVYGYAQSSSEVNEFLRHGKVPWQGEDAIVREINQLDSATRPLPRPLVVYRGVGDRLFPGGPPSPGDEVFDPGFVGTSLIPTMATTEGRKYQLELHVRRGTPAIWTDPVGGFRSEMELTLGRGRSLKIRNVEELPPSEHDRRYGRNQPNYRVVAGVRDGGGWVDSLKAQQRLGGSTGAELSLDPETGKLFVVKGGASPEHIREEGYADEAYRALGVPIPNSAIYESSRGPLKVADYLQGAKPFGQEDLPAIRSGLGADALLANWDVLGLENDNILTQGGVPYRVDTGGSLRYRAMGAPKGGAFGQMPSEDVTLRQKNEELRSVTDEELGKQFEDIYGRRQELLDALPDELRGIIEARLGNLLTKYGRFGGGKVSLTQSLDKLSALDEPVQSDVGDDPDAREFWLVVDGLLTPFKGTLATLAPHIKRLVAEGHSVQPGKKPRPDDLDLGAPSGLPSASSFIKRRMAGGPVDEPMGNLPVFGRGRSGITPNDWGDIGERVRSLYGFPYELQDVPIDEIEPTHDVKEERVLEYLKLAQSGSPIPPIVLGPRRKVQDGHHRLETARRLGHQTQLAYAFSGNEEDLPDPLKKKLGLEVKQAFLGAIVPALAGIARGIGQGMAMQAGMEMMSGGNDEEQQYAAGGVLFPAGLLRMNSGGQQKKGKPYIVGELGPEMFWPTESGYIFPHHQTGMLETMVNSLPHRRDGGWVGDTPEFPCDVCGREFSSIEELNDHRTGMRGHDREDPGKRINRKRARKLYRKSRYYGPAASSSGPTNAGMGADQFTDYDPASGGGSGGSGGGAKDTGFGPAGGGPIRVHVENFSDLKGAFGTASAGLNFADEKSASAAFTSFGTKAAEAFKAALGGSSSADGDSGATPKRAKASTKAKAEPKVKPAPSEVLKAQEEGKKARAQLDQSFGAFDARLGKVQTDIAEAFQLSPVRALSTSIGQITANIFGGRQGIIERANQTRKLYADASRSATGLLRVEEAIDELDVLEKTQGGPSKATIAERKELEQQRVIRSQITEERTRAAEQQSKKITTKTGIVRNVAFGGAGVIAGTIAFSQGLKVVTTALTSLNDEIGKALERGNHYATLTNKLTKSLGQQTRELKGQSDAAVAAAMGQAGLGKSVGESIAPLLKQRAIVESGNAALQDQLSLIHASTQLKLQESRAAAGGPAGPLQPNGGVLGVTRSTGGAFNTPIGATPSMFEMLQQEMGLTPVQQAIGANLSPMLGFNVSPTGTMGPVTSGLQSIFGARPLMNEEEARAQAESDTFWNAPIPSILAPIDSGTQEKLAGEIEGRFQENMLPWEQSTALLQDWDDQLEKVNSSFDIFNGAMDESTKKALELAGVDKLVIDGMVKLGKTIELNGEALDPNKAIAQVRQLGTDIQRGASMPDATQMLTQMAERQLPAMIANILRQAAFQRQQVLPAQFAMQQATTPYTTFAETPTIRATENILGDLVKDQFAADQQAAEDFAETYEAEVTDAQKVIDDQRAKGRRILEEHVEPGELQALEDLGVKMRDIQNVMTQKQTNLQTAEYVNSLRVAKRSLQDSADLWDTINGKQRDSYGGLEGQNILLSRQLQLLGFAQQQRGINFSKAVAGFMAEGLTPEEIAARQDQAEYEANIQQQQLDLSRQIASNQYEQTFIGAERNYQDQQAAVALMEEGRRISQEVNDLQATLNLLSIQQGILVGNVNTDLQAGLDIEKAQLDTQYQLESVLGLEAVHAKDIAKAFKEAEASARAMVNLGWGGSVSTGHASGTGPTETGATGLLGNVSSTTRMIVGEAGAETVAVLRNPREMTASPAGGGGVMNVSINISANVSSSNDIDELVHKVTIALDRQAALLGLRAPIGS